MVSFTLVPHCPSLQSCFKLHWPTTLFAWQRVHTHSKRSDWERYQKTQLILAPFPVAQLLSMKIGVADTSHNYRLGWGYCITPNNVARYLPAHALLWTAINKEWDIVVVNNLLLQFFSTYTTLLRCITAKPVSLCLILLIWMPWPIKLKIECFCLYIPSFHVAHCIVKLATRYGF